MGGNIPNIALWQNSERARDMVRAFLRLALWERRLGTEAGFASGVTSDVLLNASKNRETLCHLQLSLLSCVEAWKSMVATAHSTRYPSSASRPRKKQCKCRHLLRGYVTEIAYR